MLEKAQKRILMFKKIKDTIEKIKDELDPRRDKFKKEVIKRGIFNIELFASELGLIPSEVKKELQDLMDEGHIKGFFTFGDTEFVTFEHLTENLNQRMEDIYKIDLKKLCEDFGVSFQTIHELIDELCRKDLKFGFFDIPENATFFNFTKEERDKFISMLKKGKVHVTELAEFIDEFLESKEDVDIGSLISDIQSEEALDDWDMLAKDAIDATLGKKRARIWIENLIFWNKIRGNFSADGESFIPRDVITREITSFINSSGRIKILELQKKLAIKDLDELKRELSILEKNNVIIGYLTVNEDEFVTEKRASEEIIKIFNERNQDIMEISEIRDEIKLDELDAINLIKKLVREKKLGGMISKDDKKIFTLRLLNKTIMDQIENNEQIKLETINQNFQLPHKDLADHVESLINKYDLRVLMTWDKSEVIKEEKMLFILMDVLKKNKKSNLSEVSRETRIEAKKVVDLIKYMLEFGLIKGDLSDKEFNLK